ncbi:hypothetical protein [Nonlabens sp.]
MLYFSRLMDSWSVILRYPLSRKREQHHLHLILRHKKREIPLEYFPLD